MGSLSIRIKGVSFILWQSRHMIYHVVLGFLWVWVVSERWNEFRPMWLLVAAIASLIPDLDHLVYFFGYGKSDAYTQTLLGFIRCRQWRSLFVTIATEHKKQTNLTFHNFYTVGVLLIVSVVASFVDWQAGVVLFGAMVSHFLFDITDDVVQLGGINPNWKRWGSGRGRNTRRR